MQILLLDVVFSLDSVITAVGTVDEVGVMIVAAVLVMLLASGAISAFVKRPSTVKMLALSFLILIGMTLVAEGLHFHVPKGYRPALRGAGGTAEPADPQGPPGRAERGWAQGAGALSGCMNGA